MGLLDDAIREHLDLKRRRGADPAAVARMEQEALGPVRREPTTPEPSVPEPRAEEHGEQPAPAAGAAEEPHAAAEAPASEAAAAPAELPAEERHEPPHGDPLLQPTTEYRVEDHHDDEEEHAEPHDDVLEETPDFLQETPEHDRLWFEQRPPRDFDFDG